MLISRLKQSSIREAAEKHDGFLKEWRVTIADLVLASIPLLPVTMLRMLQRKCGRAEHPTWAWGLPQQAATRLRVAWLASIIYFDHRKIVALANCKAGGMIVNQRAKFSTL